MHKNKQLFASDRALALCRELLGGGRSGRPRVFPFLQLPKWRAEKKTQPEMSVVLSNPKHFYISHPERSLSLSLSLGWEGGLEVTGKHIYADSAC